MNQKRSFNKFSSTKFKKWPKGDSDQEENSDGFSEENEEFELEDLQSLLRELLEESIDSSP